MILTVRTFGITRDILGGSVVRLTIDGTSVSYLRSHLIQHYPQIESLNSLLIAVNHSYAPDEMELKETDEIALIPPVSGG
jgi:molybdopterin converting factor small subunit